MPKDRDPKEETTEQSAGGFDRFDSSSASRKGKRETKRIRGEIACKECRRLKVRCDRLVPCSTCTRRGCAALCPNGTIPPGEGSRFVLAATDHLSRKMSKLEERMHSLEDALAILNSDTPGAEHPHPLLASSRALDDNGVEEEKDDDGSEPESSALMDALGALHITDEGRGRFYGPSGGSESLLLEANTSPTSSIRTRPTLLDLDPSYLPEEINRYFRAFPFTPQGPSSTSVQTMIEAWLPPIARATQLCDFFLENTAWMTQILTRRHLISELLPTVYSESADRTRVQRSFGPHDLSMFLGVIAIGALVDPELPPYNEEAQHYHRLSRAAFCIQNPVLRQSLSTVKALHLMSIYNGMSGKELNLDYAYSLLNFACEIAHKIGLHLDPSVWGITGREAYDRRAYLHNLVSADMWQALITGRPPVFSPAFIECRIPTVQEEDTYQHGEPPVGFGVWGFTYAKECLFPVVKAILTAKPPSYRVVMEIDRKIREFAATSSYAIPVSGNTPTMMLSFIRSHYEELIMLFLHRSFFARAMVDHPSNPSASLYSHSFHTTYKSACVIIETTRTKFYEHPLLLSRIWRVWTICFSAVVIVGTVAARALREKMEPDPLQLIESAYALFKSAAEISNRAARAMPTLEQLRRKAYQARQQSAQVSISPPEIKKEECDDDELATFSGKTRLFSNNDHKRSRSSPQTAESFAPYPPGNLPSTSTANMHGQLEPFEDPSHPFWNGPLQDPSPGVPGSLPAGWENLYREVTSYSLGGPIPGVGDPYDPSTLEDCTRLDDKWSLFMQDYGRRGDMS
ncbi:hypothetical protein PLICRDRAFT_38677 [Plicaturopsis crispa FD-325 SS-3]|nr:hypothetical protein PLICRDRAFT_38677 [Plicaturopsis crispa FD-325 SS-3]